MLENYLAYNRSITAPRVKKTEVSNDIVEISEGDFIHLNGIEVDVQYISEEDRVKLREMYR